MLIWTNGETKMYDNFSIEQILKTNNVTITETAAALKTTAKTMRKYSKGEGLPRKLK